jgi:hypothetical protein
MDSAKIDALRTLLAESKSWKREGLRAKSPKHNTGSTPESLIDDGDGPDIESLKEDQDEATGEDGGVIQALLARMRKHSAK